MLFFRICSHQSEANGLNLFGHFVKSESLTTIHAHIALADA